jgi:effector-binding domain-containing protein
MRDMQEATMTHVRILAGALACLIAAASVPLSAQTVPPPVRVETQPLPPLPQAPATVPPAIQAPTQAPALPPAAQAPAVPPAASGPAGPAVTLAPPPADPSTPDEVQLTSRPAITVQGQSTWDDGYETLTKAFDVLRGEAAKAGLRVTGVPLATFLETDDLGFRFEAQLPVASVPSTRPPGMAAELLFGATPAGRAIRFAHRAPYDDIDSTYEAISAYLDSKGIEVKENFTEEYVNPGVDAGDVALEIFIYVLPK